MRLPRPVPEDNEVKQEEEALEDAQQDESHYAQSRRRVRYLDDGGVVVEVQEQRFVERRIQWQPPSVGIDGSPQDTGAGKIESL